MNGIEVTNLRMGYSQKTVAKGLTATFAAGQLSCLVGRNGVGKSTLLRTLAGTLPPLAGSVTVGGKTISGTTIGGTTIGGNNTRGLSRQELARTVSVVLTQRPDVRGVTVEQLVAMGRQPYTNLWGTLRQTDREAVDEAIAQVGIAPLRTRMVHTLSDGEWQKAMLAKALAQHTPVILLDEPTAFLDYPSKVEAMTLLRSLAHDTGKTILLSTHELELAARLADAWWALDPDGLRSLTREGMEQYIRQQQQ